MLTPVRKLKPEQRSQCSSAVECVVLSFKLFLSAALEFHTTEIFFSNRIPSKEEKLDEPQWHATAVGGGAFF